MTMFIFVGETQRPPEGRGSLLHSELLRHEGRDLLPGWRVHCGPPSAICSGRLEQHEGVSKTGHPVGTPWLCKLHLKTI